MIRLLLFALVLNISLLSSAQNYNGENKLRTISKFDFGFQGIGFTYEPRLSNKMTIDLSGGAGGGYEIAEGSIDYNWPGFHPAFYLSATPKFFYNRQKRIEKGRRSWLNSGNYIGMRIKLTTPAIASENTLRESLLINLHWGIQMNLGKRCTFNAHGGAGYAQDLTNHFGTIYPAIDLRFSYVLLRSNN